MVAQMWDQMYEMMEKEGEFYDIMTFDNRTRRMRDPDEGRLHCVQPAHELSLAKPTTTVSRSSHRYCDTCENVLEYFCAFRAPPLEEVKKSTFAKSMVSKFK